MTDVPDGSGQIPRRTPRVSDGGAPVSGALAMALAAIALVAGFFILRSVSDGGEQSLDLPGTGSETEQGNGTSGDEQATTTTVAALPTTTTEPPLVTTGASVIVANANGVGGSAGSMTRALETVAGFTVVDATNAATTVGDLDTSVIYYDASIAGAQSVAESLNQVLGGDLEVLALPSTPPTRDGTMNGAGVLLMLGNDKAGKTLEELAPADAASVVTNPPLAGETTTTVAG